MRLTFEQLGEKREGAMPVCQVGQNVPLSTLEWTNYGFFPRSA